MCENIFLHLVNDDSRFQSKRFNTEKVRIISPMENVILVNVVVFRKVLEKWNVTRRIKVYGSVAHHTDGF